MLFERFEDPLPVIVRYANSGVLYGKDEIYHGAIPFYILFTGRQQDMPALGEFDSVTNQIEENLP